MEKGKSWVLCSRFQYHQRTKRVRKRTKKEITGREKEGKAAFTPPFFRRQVAHANGKKKEKKFEERKRKNSHDIQLWFSLPLHAPCPCTPPKKERMKKKREWVVFVSHG